MTWDKLKVAQIFFRRAGALHPEEETERQDEVLARQDVLYDCYMSSFSREHLITRLHEIVAGNIQMPEEQEVNAVRYRDAYTQEAREILSAVERGDFDD